MRASVDQIWTMTAFGAAAVEFGQPATFALEQACLLASGVTARIARKQHLVAGG